MLHYLRLTKNIDVLADESINLVPDFAIHFLSETNQELIMSQGGIELLASTAANAEDPQTLRMVAGAIANLCGNGDIIFKERYLILLHILNFSTFALMHLW